MARAEDAYAPAPVGYVRATRTARLPRWNVPEAQGGCPQGPAYCTYWVRTRDGRTDHGLGRAVGVPPRPAPYVPATVSAYRGTPGGGELDRRETPR